MPSVSRGMTLTHDQIGSIGRLACILESRTSRFFATKPRGALRSANTMRRCSQSTLVLLLLLVVAVTPGCDGKSSSEKSSEPKSKTTAAEKSKTVKTEPVVEKPSPSKVWEQTFANATAKVEGGELAQAKEAISSLDDIYPAGEAPSEEQQQKLKDLNNQIAAAIEKVADDLRESNLVKADEQMKLGEYAEASRLLGEVFSNAPTSDQKSRHDQMVKLIERRRSKLRDLKNFMTMLASSDAADASAARNALRKEPEVAIPLLRKSAAQFDKPVLVRNTLDTLRLISRVDETLPIIIDVLGSEAAAQNWDDAVRVLQRFTQPGVGPATLQLALTAKTPEHRSAALTAFGNAADPPVDTLITLFPLIYAAPGPDTVASLRAALRGVQIHGQYDLFAQRGFETKLSDEQSERLAQLPERLAEIKTAGEKDANLKDAGFVANALLMALGRTAPRVLEGVKVLSVGAEQPDSPGAKVFDGQWNTIDLTMMWVYPTAANRHFIVLDLGSERTVAGVKVWNHNQQSYPQYGWKIVNIGVSNDSTDPKVVGSGIVPMAPGAADRPDFSTIIPIPYVTGRFVRLACPERWSNAAVSGLAEIQVIGF